MLDYGGCKPNENESEAADWEAVLGATMDRLVLTQIDSETV
jgi:hypothetical protein